ncbi:hypothetical protein, partial [Micromonospora sp. NPDC003776]
MPAYHEAARPVRLLAALAAGTAVLAAFTPGRPGRWSRADAAGHQCLPSVRACRAIRSRAAGRSS